ncbi:hypothetical protein [Nocardioides sp.]|uniref:hypothetical protein n=1 Tax=Nocardioides sp. TaxID=35761 RepID=UPI003D138B6D
MTTHSHPAGRLATALLAPVLALGLVGASTSTASAADSTPITRANTSLATAKAEFQAHHPGRAVAALRRLRVQVGQAHVAAASLIGKPPTDPESDDLPGPPAVLAVLALEHRVTMGVVPLHDGRVGAGVVDELRRVLVSTHHRRDAILARIIALPPEGDGADYADGMADRLGQFPAEVTLLTNGLSTYHLTAAARTGLTNGLARVQATQATVEAAYGGGERRLPH